MSISKSRQASKSLPHPFKVMAIYKFAPLPDCAALREAVAEFCGGAGIRGTLILAPEGINGTVAGSPGAIDRLWEWLEKGNVFKGRLRGAEVKFAEAETMPFYRFKLRLKPEIVTLRAPQVDPTRRVGTYIAPTDWNELIAREDIKLIDTRNAYETRLGTFRNAIDPATKTFTEFKNYVAENLDPARDKKVAMFCTGGIRCEKASSFLLAQGFEEVFHLKGGILNYLEQVPAEKSLWQGECFVFDERVSVGHGLADGQAVLCRACRMPLTPDERQSPDFVEGEQCPHCADKAAKKRARAAARQRQIDLAQTRGTAHLGDDAAKSARSRRAAKKQQRAADRARNRQQDNHPAG